MRLVRDLALPNVGILFQPTVFEAQPALKQFELQQPWVRHLHLQNRAVGERGRFTRLGEGAVPWREILARIVVAGRPVAASLEFVPSAICPVEAFSFEPALAQAVAEAAFIEAYDED